MAAFWPIGTAQIICIVSYPIRKKSRFWLFTCDPTKKCIIPSSRERLKGIIGRGHDLRLTNLTLIGSICMSDAHPLFDNSYLIIFRRTPLLFASNNCKLGEAGRVVSGRSLGGAYNSWWQCHRGVTPDGFVRLRNQNQTRLTISAFYFCYFSSFHIPICCYFIFPQKRKSVL